MCHSADKSNNIALRPISVFPVTFTFTKDSLHVTSIPLVLKCFPSFVSFSIISNVAVVTIRTLQIGHRFRSGYPHPLFPAPPNLSNCLADQSNLSIKSFSRSAFDSKYFLSFLCRLAGGKRVHDPSRVLTKESDGTKMALKLTLTIGT